MSQLVGYQDPTRLWVTWASHVPTRSQFIIETHWTKPASRWTRRASWEEIGKTHKLADTLPQKQLNLRRSGNIYRMRVARQQRLTKGLLPFQLVPFLVLIIMIFKKSERGNNREGLCHTPPA